MKTCIAFLLLALSSCGLYEKNQSSNEIEQITEQVLKHKEGVALEVRPLPMEKK